MSIYYIAGYPISDELYHHGVKGQSWGKRRFQNLDGSLTMLGRQHYDVGLPLNANGQQYLPNQVSTTPMQNQNGIQSRSTIAQQQAAQQIARQQMQQQIQSNIEVNDKSSIKTAQQNLKNLGYNLNKYGADGKIGNETRSAINAFKKDHGLVQDGKLDAATSRMMESESKSVLKKGSSGENVVQMQNTLKTLGYDLKNYGSDGKFGAETQRALNDFKKAHGLPENGIYDRATRLAMAKELSARTTNISTQSSVQQPISTAQPAVTTQQNPVSTVEGTQSIQSFQPQPEVIGEEPTSETDSKQTAESKFDEKAKNKKTERTGKKKTEQIIDALDDSGKQIADQHKRLSELIGKEATKVGDSISDASKGISSSHGKLVSSIISTADSIKDAADKRAKMYERIIAAADTVSTSSIQVSKELRDASRELVKQHNRLVSEISDIKKKAEKNIKKASKKVKKTRKSVSSVFSSARATINKGNDVILNMFGI